MFRINRCIAMESNLVVARGWAKRRERTASRLGVSFGWRKWGKGINILSDYCGDG